MGLAAEANQELRRLAAYTLFRDGATVMSYRIQIPWRDQAGIEHLRHQTAATTLDALEVMATRRWRGEPRALVEDEAGRYMSNGELLVRAIKEGVPPGDASRFGRVLADLVASDLHPFRHAGSQVIDTPPQRWHEAGAGWAAVARQAPPAELLDELAHRYGPLADLPAFTGGAVDELAAFEHQSSIRRMRAASAPAATQPNAPSITRPPSINRTGGRRP